MKLTGTVSKAEAISQVIIWLIAAGWKEGDGYNQFYLPPDAAYRVWITTKYVRFTSSDGIITEKIQLCDLREIKDMINWIQDQRKI